MNMDSVQPNKPDISAKLEQLGQQAILQGHRYLAVLSGREDWLREQLDDLEKLRRQALLITDKTNIPPNYTAEFTVAKKAKQYLGQEYQHVIWDACCGIHPEGLSAISGVVRAGGLLLLLVPEWERFGSAPDQDYLRMLSSEEELADCRGYFLQWIKQSIQEDYGCFLIRQGHPFPDLPPIISGGKQETSYPSLDQQKAIAAIEKVSKGHRNRPLVIKADRGRGKSSVLGMAAAKLAIQGSKVLITAPKQKACDQAFIHYDKHLNATKCLGEIQGCFSFISPDALVQSIPDASLVLVDEAAAIPVPILKSILSSYSRVVFATTVHGYEGTGRGFSIRFRKIMQKIRPEWREIELSEPVRWAENDPLENWTFKAFCLDADLHKINKSEDEIEATPLKDCRFEWVDKNALSEDSFLLKGLIGLLVNAHYQTSPDDLRLVLDHPHAVVGMVRQDGNVIGAVLLLSEGGINDPQLGDGLVRGIRRPRGHLVPQALAYNFADPDALKNRSLRVTRIAVHPDLQGKGLGAMMLLKAKQRAESLSLDYLSTSFGYETRLLSFWRQNGFELLRLGRTKDAASGSQSVILALPLSEESRHKFVAFKTLFFDSFLYDLPRTYRQLDTICVEDVLSSLGDVAKQDQHNGNEEIIQAYAQGKRQIDESRAAIYPLVRHSLSKGVLGFISDEDRGLLVRAFIQGCDEAKLISQYQLSGRKSLDQRLRAAVDLLLTL